LQIASLKWVDFEEFISGLLRPVFGGKQGMKVQSIRFPDTDRSSWIVLGDDYLPVKPILVFLKFQEDLGRSPYTIRASAHHLKLYWEFLRDVGVGWKEVDVARLATFISWLRDPQPGVVSLGDRKARRTDATINQILGVVHVFYDFHARLKNAPDLPLYRFLEMPGSHYKPFLYGIAKAKPTKSRVVSVKPEENQVKTLTDDQVQKLLDACTRTRDKFLLALLFETGMRIGQALGLRHEDIKPEDNQVRIVPRDNNENGARAKTRSAYLVPGLPPSLMELYTDYLISDLGALEADHLPDYVFINLWEGEKGRPMTYANVRSLIRRLQKRTGVRVIMRDKLRKVNPPAKQPRPCGVAPGGYNAALDLSHNSPAARSARVSGILVCCLVRPSLSLFECNG
jgi:integrase/recombinase XerD